MYRCFHPAFQFLVGKTPWLLATTIVGNPHFRRKDAEKSKFWFSGIRVSPFFDEHGDSLPKTMAVRGQVINAGSLLLEEWWPIRPRLRCLDNGDAASRPEWGVEFPNQWHVEEEPNFEGSTWDGCHISYILWLELWCLWFKHHGCCVCCIYNLGHVYYVLCVYTVIVLCIHAPF